MLPTVSKCDLEQLSHFEHPPNSKPPSSPKLLVKSSRCTQAPVANLGLKKALFYKMLYEHFYSLAGTALISSLFSFFFQLSTPTQIGDNAFFVHRSGFWLRTIKNLQSAQRASKLGIRGCSKHQTLLPIGHANHLEPPLGEPRTPQIGASPP